MSAQLPLFPSSTSSAVDSPAKTSAPPDVGGGSTENAPASGASSPASSTKRARASSRSKIARCFQGGGSIASSAILPRWGTWERGEWSPLQRPERATSAIDSSSLLPTPSASPYGTNKGGAAGRAGPERPSLDERASRGMLPTPTCNESTYQRDRNGNVYPSLLGLAKLGALPTPTAHLSKEGGFPAEGTLHTPTLTWTGLSTLGLLPTPTATLADKGGRLTPRKSREGGTLIEALSARGAVGSLHPQFVEWMMGLPAGWTDLDGDDQPAIVID